MVLDIESESIWVSFGSRVGGWIEPRSMKCDPKWHRKSDEQKEGLWQGGSWQGAPWQGGFSKNQPNQTTELRRAALHISAQKRGRGYIVQSKQFLKDYTQGTRGKPNHGQCRPDEAIFWFMLM